MNRTKLFDNAIGPVVIVEEFLREPLFSFGGLNPNSSPLHKVGILSMTIIVLFHFLLSALDVFARN